MPGVAVESDEGEDAFVGIAGSEVVVASSGALATR